MRVAVKGVRAGGLLYNWALCPAVARDMTCLSPLRKYGNLRITTYQIFFIWTKMLYCNKKYKVYNNRHNAVASYISSNSKRAFQNPFMKLLHIETACNPKSTSENRLTKVIAIRVGTEAIRTVPNKFYLNDNSIFNKLQESRNTSS